MRWEAMLVGRKGRWERKGEKRKEEERGSRGGREEGKESERRWSGEALQGGMRGKLSLW